MEFVLDNSVAMRWLLTSNKTVDQRYAEAVLKSLVDCEAIVPNLWHLEAASVLIKFENTGEISIAEVEGFIAQLNQLCIVVDTSTAASALHSTLVLARNYKLSSYDAAYLELAIRLKRPIATLDKSLIRAAKKSGVPRYLKN